MKEFIGELPGTFIPVLFGCGSVAVAILFGEYSGIILPLYSRTGHEKKISMNQERGRSRMSGNPRKENSSFRVLPVFPFIPCSQLVKPVHN